MNTSLMSGMLATPPGVHVPFLAGEWGAASVGLGAVMAAGLGGVLALGLFVVSHLPAVEVRGTLSEHADEDDRNVSKRSSSPDDRP